MTEGAEAAKAEVVELGMAGAVAEAEDKEEFDAEAGAAATAADSMAVTAVEAKAEAGAADSMVVTSVEAKAVAAAADSMAVTALEAKAEAGAAADCTAAGSLLHTQEQAGRHNITFSVPAADFFEGALLGNGGLGVVVTTRPDAVMLHFGHNNVWDIRIAEHHAEDILTFQEVYDRFASLPADLRQLTDNPWYREYCEMAGDNYSKPYPRPMPCGSLLLRYDRRRAEVLGHTVHIGDGRCTVDFLINGKPAVFELFVEAEQDRVWMSVTDTATGSQVPLFHEARLIPDPKTPQEFPRRNGIMTLRLACWLLHKFCHTWSSPLRRTFRMSGTRRSGLHSGFRGQNSPAAAALPVWIPPGNPAASWPAQNCGRDRQRR